MAITQNDFNSTKIPGTCKPMNFATLDKFKELQRQMNRVAKVRGFSIIAVDGDIGPGTTSLFNKIFAQSMTCSQIATLAEAYAAQLKAIADQQGVPATVSAPKPASPPSIISPATGAIVPQPASASILDAFQNMGISPTQLMIVGGLAGLVIYKKMKKGRR